jgi:hypothetical protein
VAVIDDVLQSIANAIEKITEASDAATAAVSEAETGLEAAAAFGIEASVEGMTAVKEKLETLVTELGSVSSVAEEAQTAAQGVAAGT